MSISDFERSMIEALYAKQLRERLGDLLENDGVPVAARRQATELAKRIARFDSAMAQTAKNLQASISEIAPAAAVELDPGRLDGRLRIVAPDNSFGDVLTHLGRERFVLMFPLSEGAMLAIHRGRLEVSMIAPGGPITSVSLTRGGNETGVPVRKRIRPGVSDLRFVSLPKWAWWAYWGIKPIRLVSHALRGNRRGDRLGPFLGTPRDLVTSLLDLVELSSSDTLVDLGCGDGRVLIEAASRVGCRGRGVEMDPLLAAIAERRVAEAGVENLVIIQKGDIGDAELGDASVVFAFLPVRVLQRMLRSILDRMPPGSKLLAHEQEEADFLPEADARHLVVTDSGLTVAHVWLV